MMENLIAIPVPRPFTTILVNGETHMLVAPSVLRKALAVTDTLAPAIPVEPEVTEELIERLLDAQQDINLAANETMSQSLCNASALIDEIEPILRRAGRCSHANRDFPVRSDTRAACPFCGDPMQIEHDTLSHVDRAECILGAYAWDDSFLAAWNRRAPDTLASKASETGGWRDIETAPERDEFLALGYYYYPGDSDPTVYRRVACRSGVEGFPWTDEEGEHPPEFFSFWQPLPELPALDALTSLGKR